MKLKEFDKETEKLLKELSSGKAKVLTELDGECFFSGGNDEYSGKEAFGMDNDPLRYEKAKPMRAFEFYNLIVVELEGRDDEWFNAKPKYNGNYILLNSEKGLKNRFNMMYL